MNRKLAAALIATVLFGGVAYALVGRFNPEREIFSAGLASILFGSAMLISIPSTSGSLVPELNWVRLALMFAVLAVVPERPDWTTEFWSVPPLIGAVFLAEALAVKFRAVARR